MINDRIQNKSNLLLSTFRDPQEQWMVRWKKICNREFVNQEEIVLRKLVSLFLSVIFWRWTVRTEKYVHFVLSTGHLNH